MENMECTSRNTSTTSLEHSELLVLSMVFTNNPIYAVEQLVLNVTRNRNLTSNGPGFLVQTLMVRQKNMVLSHKLVCIKYRLILIMSLPPFTTLPALCLRATCYLTCPRQSNIAGRGDCLHFSSSLGAEAH